MNLRLPVLKVKRGDWKQDPGVMIQTGAPKYSLQTHLWLSVQHDLMCIVFMWSEFVSALAHRWQLPKGAALGFSLGQEASPWARRLCGFGSSKGHRERAAS